MPPSRSESTALAATGDKGGRSSHFCCRNLIPFYDMPQANKQIITVQRGGKKLTRGKHISRDQAFKIRKLRLRSLQGMKKRQADLTITRMLNKLSMDSDVEKKIETTIKNLSEKPLGVTFEMDVGLEQENITNQRE
ncbi:hypothetical protein EAF00_004561 [Botryotinia globosa]|nr:hypothetical protein EAF00_004561 [Botryotinia globosa]